MPAAKCSTYGGYCKFSLGVFMVFTMFVLGIQPMRMIERYSNFNMSTDTHTIHLPIPEIRPVVLSAELSPWDRMQVGCLADNIYSEARGEPVKGQIAVAQVTINRTKSKQFPDTICNVVYQRNDVNCAFSWTCHPQPYRIARHSELYATIRSRALTLYNLYRVQPHLKDITDGSLYYLTKDCHPPWRKHMTVRLVVGQQVFLATK